MLSLPLKFTTEEVKDLLQKELPQLNIQNITLLDNGWENAVFDVNGEYIFRFPKTQETQFDIELKLLNILRGKTTIPIPVSNSLIRIRGTWATKNCKAVT
jgi:hypothetical protein